jgi:hypothetical protein
MNSTELFSSFAQAVSKHNSVKAFKGTEMRLFAFLTPALDG